MPGAAAAFPPERTCVQAATLVRVPSRVGERYARMNGWFEARPLPLRFVVAYAMVFVAVLVGLAVLPPSGGIPFTSAAIIAGGVALGVALGSGVRR